MPQHSHQSAHWPSAKGFTLIELSIVMVIIGLVVGGVLVGRDLIAAATIRAQIAQIEKYTISASTFRVKYGYVPGDMPADAATQFGFSARGSLPGEGDGNGVIQSKNISNTGYGYSAGMGETALFWADLTTAGLIDGKFSTATATSFALPYVDDTTTPSTKAFLPEAKIGRNNYIAVWSGGWQAPFDVYGMGQNGQNYFSINTVEFLRSTDLLGNPGMRIIEAANIDKKIDDGAPQTGRVGAVYICQKFAWAGGGPTGCDDGAYGTSGTTATAQSKTTCYDNGNVAGTTQQYSISSLTGNGQNINCAISIQLQ